MKSKLKNIFDSHFIKNLNLDGEKEYEIDYIDSKDLLTPYRMDLIPKIKFLESINNNYQTDFYENMYKESIRAFSNGTYKEPGNSEKNSFQKYKDTFLKLQTDILENGFDEKKSVLAIGKNKAIIDGGHRTAIAIYNKLKMPYIKIDECETVYDLKYFKDRTVEESMLDSICYEYCKLNKNTIAICLWPTLDNDKKKMIINMLSKELNIIYKKNINLNYNGMRNFMIQIYGHQDWIGNIDNHFNGINGKVDNCYVDGRETTLIVVEEKDVQKVLRIKSEIRELVKLGNHSMHSTDNQKETLQMLSLLLNKNSLHFLNNALIDKYPHVLKKLKELKKINNDTDFIISGKIILGLYGLKNYSDYNILVRNNFNNDLYKKNFDDLFYNNNCYFVFDDIKFVSLDNLELLLEKNNEKDEIELIKNINKENKLKIKLNNFKLKSKRISRGIRELLKTILVKIGLYKTIKKFLKGKK